MGHVGVNHKDIKGHLGLKLCRSVMYCIEIVGSCWLWLLWHLGYRGRVVWNKETSKTISLNYFYTRIQLVCQKNPKEVFDNHATWSHKFNGHPMVFGHWSMLWMTFPQRIVVFHSGELLFDRHTSGPIGRNLVENERLHVPPIATWSIEHLKVHFEIPYTPWN